MTDRGFKIYAELTDRYGSKVTVKESSLAGERCVWIFCENPRDLAAMPHLTETMAEQIHAALGAFLLDGIDR